LKAMSEEYVKIFGCTFLTNPRHGDI
jgi:hypothetical protein